jgi:6-pyruvoyltetrahydropterin/6-carboxytetrahydropterin synthase
LFSWSAALHFQPKKQREPGPGHNTLLLFQFSPSAYLCRLMEIYKDFSFDSAHFLPHVPDGHKCKNMHGHTYRLRVFIKGTPHPRLGWIMDFKELKDIVNPLIDQLDHKLLNDIEGLENSTAENITIWIWNRIKPLLPNLNKIELYETPTTGVIYSGE